MAFALVADNDGITALDADGRAHRELDGRPVTWLARTSAGTWAVADKRSLVRRDDDGTWHDVVTADTDLTCVLPLADGGFAGTRDGMLLRFADDSLDRVAGFEDVAGRETWHAVPSGVPYVRSLTATADGAAVLAGVHVGGIPRSTDDGATWTPTLDPEIDVHEIRTHPTDPAVAVGAAGYGFIESTDGGASWTVITDGLHVTYARAVAFTADAALVSVSDGPMATEGSAIYRRTIATEQPLERCLDGLPALVGNIDTDCLDASGEHAVLVDGVGAVFASGDDGLSWFHVADIPNATATVLA